MECPKCGSTNIMPTYIKGKFKCMECGATFSAPKEGAKPMDAKQEGTKAAFALKGK